MSLTGKAHHLESLWKHRPDSGALVERALYVLQTALAGFDIALGRGSSQSIECCEYLGEVLLQSNHFSEALPYCRRVYVHMHTNGNGSGSSGGNDSASAGVNSTSRGNPNSPTRRSSSESSESKHTHSKANNSVSTPSTATATGKYGPMHMRTGESAYRLATVLENCPSSTSSSSLTEDAARHIEASELFLQAYEIYRRHYEAAAAIEAAEREQERKQSGGGGGRINVFADHSNSRVSKYRSGGDSKSNNGDGDAEDNDDEEEEGKNESNGNKGALNSQLTAAEYNEMMEDAMEQHQHALRRSHY